MLLKRFWRSIVSIFTGAVILGQQIPTLAERPALNLPIFLERPYPEFFPALWLGYSEEDWLYALHANGQAACESLAVFRGRLPSQQKAVPYMNIDEFDRWNAGVCPKSPIT
ncbi:hypothetical protein [Tolypothrix sp. VBCCA 56010]|uniref:hypothetical protein n=1 Tax=Tolypothrix sp. VBCCA 56010 TaxID=3137731 RepID=UPI003D7CB401